MSASRLIVKWIALSIFSLLCICYGAAVGSQTVSGGPVAGHTADDPSMEPQVSWYVIQVGSFPQLSLAEKEMSRLQQKDLEPFYRYEDTGGKGMWYRVYIGEFATRETAAESAEELVRDGIVKAYLLRKVLPEKNILFSVDDGESSPLLAEPGTEAPTAGSQTPALAAANDPTPATMPGQIETVGGPDDHENAYRLSLMEAIRFSLEGNREIDVVAYDPKQAQEDITSARSVYDTQLFADSTMRRDPNLDSSVDDIVTEDDNRTRAGIRKPLKTGGTLSTYLENRYANLNNATFPRTFKYIAAPTVELQQPLLNNIGSKKEQTAINIANFQANISTAEFRRKVIEVTNEVASVYWKLYLFKELIDINRANYEMAEEVRRQEAERFARGISQQIDVARARSNAMVRRSTLIRSQEEYKLAMDRLKLLLNWNQLSIDSDATVVPVELPQIMPMLVDETEAIETALANRPEVVKAAQGLRIREVDEALAKHQRLPKLDAFGRYSVSGYGDDIDDAWSDISFDEDDIWEVGIQFEWAIGNRSAKSQYRKKTLSRKQADAQLKRVKDDIRLEVKQVLHRLEAVNGEIDANQNAMTAAAKVVEGEFTRFDLGQTSNEELLRAQDLLAAASRGFARAVADYNTTIQELARVQGVLPEGITIENARR